MELNNHTLENVVVYPVVILPKTTRVEDFCVLGVYPEFLKVEPGFRQLELKIGERGVIRSHTVIYTGTEIGNDFQAGHKANIREFCKIGNDVSIGTHSVLECYVVVENRVRVHSNVFIPEYTVLRERAWIGPNVVFTNAWHPLCPRAKVCMEKAVRVGKKAIIGANATILPGVKIGEEAFVGAGSVVTKNVADDGVVVGNPARHIGKTSELKCKYNDMGIENPYRD